MATRIQVPEAALPDLVAIRELGPERLSQVLTAIESIKPLPLRPRTLHKSVAKALDKDQASARKLVRQLLSLYQVVNDGETKNVDELLSHISESLKNSWTEEEVQRWQLLSPTFGQLLLCDAIRTVSKATTLEYDFANLFRSGRIVTDIRPVFNDLDGDEMTIDGAVISHTLRLLYDNDSGDHDLSLAMDKRDILALMKQCERALEKAKCARTLVKRDGFPCVICGEDSDA